MQTNERRILPRAKKRLTGKQLQKLQWAAWRLGDSLKRAAEGDEVLKSLAEAAQKVAGELYGLRQQRELVEAERADKGEVVWTLFLPRTSLFDSRNTITRTPNRLIRDIYWLSGPTTHVTSRELAYKDLEFELSTRLLDLEKFRAHALKVDEQWRAWRERDKRDRSDEREAA
jgi:hypothetical protein